MNNTDKIRDAAFHLGASNDKEVVSEIRDICNDIDTEMLRNESRIEDMEYELSDLEDINEGLCLCGDHSTELEHVNMTNLCDQMKLDFIRENWDELDLRTLEELIKYKL